MEGTDQINNINRCATRISCDGGKNLYGSGVLYVIGSKENAFIFTAAHVIYEIWKEKKQDVKKLHFTMLDGEDQCEIIELDCKIFSDNEGKKQLGDIYIHEKYDPESYANDIAIICIPNEKWMDSLHTFQINKSKVGEDQKGYGFPKSADKEAFKKGQSELAGKMDLNGTVINQDHGKYSFAYKKDVQEVDASRDNIMRGYSGSGLFAEENSSYVLRGIVSSEYGQEPAGNVVWVSEATLLLEVMQQQNISPQLPQSFISYKNIVVSEFDIGYEDEKDFFDYIACDLIEKKGLVPSKVFENDFEKIRCDRGKWYCDKYWKGQLKKAVILGGLKNIKVDNMKNPKINMPNPYEHDIVEIKFLCTDDKFEKVITELIQKNFFSNGTITDKTIFLWNGSEIKEYPRWRFRRVICDIVDSKRNDYSSNELYQKFSELLPKDEGYVRFDIIKGGLLSCNLALIGTERIMESLENVDVDPEKMKSQFEKQIKKIWKV